VTAWVNGRIVDGSATLDVRDRGFTLGDGIFETIAVVDGVPLRLHMHLARLAAGAAALSIPIRYGEVDIASAIDALLGAAGVTEGAVRLTLSRGVGARGVAMPADPTPTVTMTAAAMRIGDPAPVRAIIARSTRRNEFSPLSNLKSLNYLDAVLARQEAALGGADDAIMLNTAGRIAEATASNVFAVIGGRLLTPPATEGALPGIMRSIVISAGHAYEEPLTVAALNDAAEIILTNVLSVRPVIALDGKIVGRGEPGPLALQLAILPRRP